MAIKKYFLKNGEKGDENQRFQRRLGTFNKFKEIYECRRIPLGQGEVQDVYDIYDTSVFMHQFPTRGEVLMIGCSEEISKARVDLESTLEIDLAEEEKIRL